MVCIIITIKIILPHEFRLNASELYITLYKNWIDKYEQLVFVFAYFTCWD